MAYLVDEMKLIQGSISKFEERFDSPYTRFLETTPSFTTYYNINNVQTTVDLGFQNVEEVLGPNSPVRFKKVKDFPLYGLEQILLDLQDTEQGLDSSYEGSATILPNTLTPTPGDYFLISYLDNDYVFQVTSIAYGTIRSNDYYKIEFQLRSAGGGDAPTDLEKQTTDSFTCVFTNIGTKEKCLIKDDDITRLVQLNQVYTQIAEVYKLFFYDKLYNSFLLTELDGTRLYDRYMTRFIMENRLFATKNDFETLYLTQEGMNAHFMLEYHSSIYRDLEMGRKPKPNAILFDRYLNLEFSSIFNFYRRHTVKSIKLGGSSTFYVPEAFLAQVESGTIEDGDNVVWRTIIHSTNEQIRNIGQLELDALQTYMDFMDDSLTTFVLVPILLFVLRSHYEKFMTA